MKPKTPFAKILLTLAALLAAVAISPLSFASSGETFLEKEKSLTGAWTLSQTGGKTFITFSEDFRTKSGPDLKVFLSPTHFAAVDGKTATKGSVFIAELKSTKGSQTYELPTGINLSDYASLLIHCEKYSVLWGGSAFNPPSS